jgi:hypothetical protein
MKDGKFMPGSKEAILKIILDLEFDTTGLN